MVAMVSRHIILAIQPSTTITQVCIVHKCMNTVCVLYVIRCLLTCEWYVSVCVCECVSGMCVCVWCVYVCTRAHVSMCVRICAYDCVTVHMHTVVMCCSHQILHIQ